MRSRAGGALRKAVSLAASFALAASLVPAAALPALADDDPGQQPAAATQADDTSVSTSAAADDTAASADEAAATDEQSGSSGDTGASADTTASQEETDGSNSIVNADMAVGKDDAIEIINASVVLATDDVQVTPTVFAYCGLNYGINVDAPTTVSLLGWSGQAPEGTLSIPSVITVGGTTYTVTGITSSALPDNHSIDAAVSDAVRADLYANAVAAAGTAPAITAITIPDTVVSIQPAAFAAYPNLRSIVVTDSNGAEAQPKTIDGIATVEGYVTRDGILYSADLTTLVAIPAGMAATAALPEQTTSVQAGALAQAKALTAVTHPGNESLAAYAGALYTADYSKLLAAPAGHRGTLTLAPQTAELAEGALYANTYTTTVAAGSNVARVAKAAKDADGFCVALPALPDGVVADVEDAGAADGNSATEGDDSSTNSNSAAEAPVAGAPATPEATQPITAIIPQGANAAPWQDAGATVVEGEAPTQGAAAADAGLTYTLTDNYTLEAAWEGGPDTAPATVVIPATAKVGGLSYPVTAVATYGFASQSMLERVVLPDTVTDLGNGAFYECTNLKTVETGAALSYISANAFKRTALTTLVLPDTVKFIGDEALSTNAATTIIAQGNVGVVDPRAMLEASNVTAYVPAASAGAWQQAAGLPAAGNHVLPFEVALGQSDYTLTMGQTIGLLDGGAMRAPGSTKAAWSYRASSVSVDTGGTLTALAPGTTAVAATLSLTVGGTSYTMATSSARVRINALPGVGAGREASADTASVETTQTDADIDAITESADENSYDINGITNEDVALDNPASSSADGAGNADGDNAAKSDASAGEDEKAAGKPSQTIKGEVPLTPVGEEKPVALLGRTFTGKATASGEAEAIETAGHIGALYAAKSETADGAEAENAEVENVAGESSEDLAAGENDESSEAQASDESVASTSEADDAIANSNSQATRASRTLGANTEFYATGSNTPNVGDSFPSQGDGYVWYTFTVTALSGKDDATRNEVSIAKYPGREPKGEITLPSKVIIDGKEFTVTSISNGDSFGFEWGTEEATTDMTVAAGFASCTEITKVTIPNSITSVEHWAFAGCWNLNSVDFQTSGDSGEIGVKNIGSEAFWGCNMDKFVVPSSLERMNPQALGQAVFGYFDISQNSKFSVLYEGRVLYGPCATDNRIFNDIQEDDKLVLGIGRDIQSFTIPMFTIPDDIKGMPSYQTLGHSTYEEIVVLGKSTFRTMSGLFTSIYNKNPGHNESLVVGDLLLSDGTFESKRNFGGTADIYAASVKGYDENGSEIDVASNNGVNIYLHSTGAPQTQVVPDDGTVNMPLALSIPDTSRFAGRITVETTVEPAPTSNDDTVVTVGSVAADKTSVALTGVKPGTATVVTRMYYTDDANGVTKTELCANETTVTVSGTSGYLPTIEYIGTDENKDIEFGTDVVNPPADAAINEENDAKYAKWEFESDTGKLTISCPFPSAANGNKKYAVADLRWTKVDPDTGEAWSITDTTSDGKQRRAVEHWRPLAAQVKQIALNNVHTPSMGFWFQGFTSMTEITFNIPEGVCDVAYLFNHWESLKTIPDWLELPSSTISAKSSFTDSAVESVGKNLISESRNAGTLLTVDDMFSRTANLKQLPDTFVLPDSVKIASNVFSKSGLTSLPKNFRIPASVQGNRWNGSTAVYRMFNECNNLTTLPAEFVLSFDLSADFTDVDKDYVFYTEKPTPMYYAGTKDSPSYQYITKLPWEAWNRTLICADDVPEGAVEFKVPSLTTTTDGATTTTTLGNDFNTTAFVASPDDSGVLNPEPAAPDYSAAGKVFALWYADAACTKPYDFGGTVSSQLTQDATTKTYKLYGKYVTAAAAGSEGALPCVTTGSMATADLTPTGTAWWSVGVDEGDDKTSTADDVTTLYIRGTGVVENLWARNGTADDIAVGYWGPYREDIEAIQMMPSTDSVDMIKWFRGMSSLEKFDGHFSKSASDLSCVFRHTTVLRTLPSGLTIPTGAKYLTAMFDGSGIETLPASMSIPSGVEIVDVMFRNTANLKSLPAGILLPSSVKSCRDMFSGSGIEALPAGFTIPENSDYNLIFAGASRLSSLPEGFTVPDPVSWALQPSNPNNGMRCIFKDCYSLMVLPDNFAFNLEEAEKIPAGRERMFYVSDAAADMAAGNYTVPLKTYYFGDNPDVFKYDWSKDNRVLVTSPVSVSLTVEYKVMQEDGTYATTSQLVRQSSDGVPQLGAVDNGHGFIGWATDEACTKPFDFNAYSSEGGVARWQAHNGGASTLTLYGIPVKAGSYPGTLYNVDGSVKQEIGTEATDHEGWLPLTDKGYLNKECSTYESGDTPQPGDAWWYLTANGELFIHCMNGAVINLERFGATIVTQNLTNPAAISKQKSAWGPYREMVKNVIMTDDVDAEETMFWFSEMTNLVSFDGFVPSHAYATTSMFQACPNLKMLSDRFKFPKILHPETAKYNEDNDPAYMYNFNRSVKNVFVAAFMFRWINSLEYLPNGFHIPDFTTDCCYMFQRATKLKALPPNFDFPSNACSYGIKGMFTECVSLASLPANMEIPSKVSDIEIIFRNCVSLTALPKGLKVPSNVTVVSGMFKNCMSLTSIPDSFEIEAPSSSLNVEGLFENCYSLKSLPASLNLSGLSTSKVSNADSMFKVSPTLDDENIGPEYDNSDWNLVWNPGAAKEIRISVEDVLGYIPTIPITTTYLGTETSKLLINGITIDGAACTSAEDWFTSMGRTLQAQPNDEHTASFYLPSDTSNPTTGSYSTSPWMTVTTAKGIVPSNDAVYYEGYIFDGWYEAVDSGSEGTDAAKPTLKSTKFDFSVAITADVSLYAKYTKIKDDASPNGYKLNALPIVEGETTVPTMANPTGVGAWWWIDRDSTLHIASDGKSTIANLFGDELTFPGTWTEYESIRSYWNHMASSVRSVSMEPGIKAVDMLGWFAWTSIDSADGIYFADGIISTSCMFRGSTIVDASTLGSIPEGVKSVRYMFARAENLSNVDGLSIPSSLEYADGMFSKSYIPSVPVSFRLTDAPRLKSTVDMFGYTNLVEVSENLNLPSNVNDISNMFRCCYSLRSVNAGFSIPASVLTTRCLFLNCVTLAAFPEGFGFAPNNNLEDVTYMFRDCWSLTTLPKSLNMNELKKVKSNNAMFLAYDSDPKNFPLLPTPPEGKPKITTFYAGDDLNGLIAPWMGLDEVPDKPVPPKEGDADYDAKLAQYQTAKDAYNAAVDKVKEYWDKSYDRVIVFAGDDNIDDELAAVGAVKVTLNTGKIKAGSTSVDKWDSATILATKVMDDQGKWTGTYEFPEPEIAPITGYTSTGWCTDDKCTKPFGGFSTDGKGYVSDAVTMYAAYKLKLEATVPATATINVATGDREPIANAAYEVTSTTVSPVEISKIEVTKNDVGFAKLFGKTSRSDVALKFTFGDGSNPTEWNAYLNIDKDATNSPQKPWTPIRLDASDGVDPIKMQVLFDLVWDETVGEPDFSKLGSEFTENFASAVWTIGLVPASELTPTPTS